MLTAEELNITQPQYDGIQDGTYYPIGWSVKANKLNPTWTNQEDTTAGSTYSKWIINNGFAFCNIGTTGLRRIDLSDMSAETVVVSWALENGCLAHDGTDLHWFYTNGTDVLKVSSSDDGDTWGSPSTIKSNVRTDDASRTETVTRVVVPLGLSDIFYAVVSDADNGYWAIKRFYYDGSSWTSNTVIYNDFYYHFEISDIDVVRQDGVDVCYIQTQVPGNMSAEYDDEGEEVDKYITVSKGIVAVRFEADKWRSNVPIEVDRLDYVDTYNYFASCRTSIIDGKVFIFTHRGIGSNGASLISPVEYITKDTVTYSIGDFMYIPDYSVDDYDTLVLFEDSVNGQIVCLTTGLLNQWTAPTTRRYSNNNSDASMEVDLTQYVSGLSLDGSQQISASIKLDNAGGEFSNHAIVNINNAILIEVFMHYFDTALFVVRVCGVYIDTIQFVNDLPEKEVALQCRDSLAQMTDWYTSEGVFYLEQPNLFSNEFPNATPFSSFAVMDGSWEAVPSENAIRPAVTVPYSGSTKTHVGVSTLNMQMTAYVVQLSMEGPNTALATDNDFDTGIVFHFQDIDNYCYVVKEPSNIKCYQVVGGVKTEIPFATGASPTYFYTNKNARPGLIVIGPYIWLYYSSYESSTQYFDLTDFNFYQVRMTIGNLPSFILPSPTTPTDNKYYLSANTSFKGAVGIYCDVNNGMTTHPKFSGITISEIGDAVNLPFVLQWYATKAHIFDTQIINFYDVNVAEVTGAYGLLNKEVLVSNPDTDPFGYGDGVATQYSTPYEIGVVNQSLWEGTIGIIFHEGGVRSLSSRWTDTYSSATASSQKAGSTYQPSNVRPTAINSWSTDDGVTAAWILLDYSSNKHQQGYTIEIESENDPNAPTSWTVKVGGSGGTLVHTVVDFDWTGLTEYSWAFDDWAYYSDDMFYMDITANNGGNNIVIATIEINYNVGTGSSAMYTIITETNPAGGQHNNSTTLQGSEPSPYQQSIYSIEDTNVDVNGEKWLTRFGIYGSGFNVTNIFSEADGTLFYVQIDSVTGDDHTKSRKSLLQHDPNGTDTYRVIGTEKFNATLYPETETGFYESYWFLTCPSANGAGYLIVPYNATIAVYFVDTDSSIELVTAIRGHTDYADAHRRDLPITIQISPLYDGADTIHYITVGIRNFAFKQTQKTHTGVTWDSLWYLSGTSNPLDDFLSGDTGFEYATLDPSEPIQEGLARAVDGLQFDVFMRSNGVLAFQQRHNMDVAFTMNDTEAINKSQDRTQLYSHIRMLGAYVENDSIDSELFQMVGHRFKEVNNPYIISELHCSRQAEYILRDMKRNITRYEAKYIAMPMLERNDRINVVDHGTTYDMHLLGWEMEFVEGDIYATYYGKKWISDE